MEFPLEIWIDKDKFLDERTLFDNSTKTVQNYTQEDASDEVRGSFACMIGHQENRKRQEVLRRRPPDQRRRLYRLQEYFGCQNRPNLPGLLASDPQHPLRQVINIHMMIIILFVAHSAILAIYYAVTSSLLGLLLFLDVLLVPAYQRNTRLLTLFLIGSIILHRENADHHDAHVIRLALNPGHCLLPSDEIRHQRAPPSHA